MARLIGPVCRYCRRESEKLFLKGEKCYSQKCPLDRRKKAPGQHPESRRKRSQYYLGLRAKQKVKRMAGMFESQFRHWYEAASHAVGPSGFNLLLRVELRLDNVVHRMGFGSSRAQARQFVRHGHILVNKKKVDIPSYMVSPGDEITVSPKFKENVLVKHAMEAAVKRGVPAWLSLDSGQAKATVVRMPERAELSVPVRDVPIEQLIVEHYSR